MNIRQAFFGKLLKTDLGSVNSVASPMTFLPCFRGRHQLDYLANDFSAEEIKVVISELPLNHAPGPNGFNGKFIRKCWSIINQIS